MTPTTIFAAQKLAELLTASDALQNQISSLANEAGVSVPAISSTQIVLSSAGADIADKSIQLTYPRVCLYCGALKNTQTEKFRSLSGTVSLTAEVWASDNMVTQTDQWIHFYVEGVTDILHQNAGDWGEGVFFPGVYDVQFLPPKAGGFGFVQSAKIICTLTVSRN